MEVTHFLKYERECVVRVWRRMSCDYKCSPAQNQHIVLKSSRWNSQLGHVCIFHSCCFWIKISWYLSLHQKKWPCTSQLPIRQASNTGSLGQAKELRANRLTTIFWWQLASKLSLQGTYSQHISSPEFGCFHSWSLKTVCLLTFKCPQVPLSHSLVPWLLLCNAVLTRQVGVVLSRGHLTVICTSLSLVQFRLYVTSNLDGLQITFLE